MEVPAVSWLTAKAEVRRSPIEGLGLVAREPVAEGEAVERLGSWPAGAPRKRCRGLVTGRDCRRLEFQAAYGNHWTPPLLRRIAALFEGR